MQNEPKFKKARMNITSDITKDYGNWTLGERGKNKPKTKPNKAKCKKAQMNATSDKTKNYNEKWTMKGFAKRTQNKPNQSQMQKSPNERKYCFNKELQRKINNEGLRKTNPIQTQSNPISNPPPYPDNLDFILLCTYTKVVFVRRKGCDLRKCTA